MFDLDRIGSISVGVLGDLAVDIYWYADMKKSELSRETPHYPLPVVREVMSPGAGGNLTANIAALKPKKLSVCGIIGDDWRGTILDKLLRELGCDTSGLVLEEGRFTHAYCKPMRMGISDVIYEDPRIDFASSEPPCAETEEKVISWLDSIDGELDVLCVCDQFIGGIVTPKVLERLNRMKTTVMVDSRYKIGSYSVRGVLKPNEDECRAALAKHGADVPDDPAEMAKKLHEITGADILLTLGEQGSIYVTGDEIIRTPAFTAEGEIDICGAGDSSLSAFACSTAAGATPSEAAKTAAAASRVTVKKIGMTGTASRDEIRKILTEKII